MTASIYLDNSATTRLRNEVCDAMRPFQTELFGNASSLHRSGRDSRRAIDFAREQIASLLHVKSQEIFFTSCATYSNNAAILGRARWVEENGLGRHIITSSIEHSSALGPSKHLQSRGWRVSVIGTNDQGESNVDQLIDAVCGDTSIISVMWANNEIGTIQPVEKIAAIAREKGIFFHTDAVQVAGKLPLNITDLNIDTLSLSGHKFHAPKGIGILYVRSGVELLPLTFGGGQENGFFPGTENVANIVGIGKAAELSAQELNTNLRHLRTMQRILIEKLSLHENVSLTGARAITQRVPGHVSVVVDQSVGAELVEEADLRGLLISSVSACSSNSEHPSHVLKALGIPSERARGALRITAGFFNNETECLLAADILSDVLQSRARQLGRRSAVNTNHVKYPRQSEWHDNGQLARASALS